MGRGRGRGQGEEVLLASGDKGGRQGSRRQGTRGGRRVEAVEREDAAVWIQEAKAWVPIEGRAQSTAGLPFLSASL